MANITPIVFESLEKTIVPVSIAGVEYKLMEADGAAITERDNSILGGTVLVDGKPSSMSGIAGIDTVLLSRCLVELKSGHKVKLSILEAWPNRIKEVLVDRCKEISGITDDEEVQENLEEQVGN